MDDIIAFLTSPGGVFAAVAAVLGIIATVQSIVRPYLERRESKARLEIADLLLSELSRSSNSYELRFVVTNTGKSKAVMRALRIQVLDRTPSIAEVETVPEAPMRVNAHRVEMIEGKDVYDIRARAFGPALPPLSFEEAEAEGFVVKMVSTELMRYKLRVEVEWYDAKEPKEVQTVQSGVFLLDFPRRVPADADTYIKLRSILAQLYPDDARARIVVQGAGLNEQHIAFSGTAINTWNSILREAENANKNANKMANVFRVVLTEYSTNTDLRAACDAYQSQLQGTSSTTSEIVSPSVSALADVVIKILFLAANPTGTTHLRLDEEIRSIDHSLRQSAYRDQFDLEQAHAVRVADLSGLLLRHRPHIVHFSGHGSAASGTTSGTPSRHLSTTETGGQGSVSGAIILEDNAGKSHPVSPRALSTVFALLKDNIRCVVLNACYSEPQAQAIAEHIDCVVGMSTAISDRAAISFATAFYQALGYGEDVKTAFELGRAEIDLENIPEEQTPQLFATKVDPSQVVLVSPKV